jgi:uncharacterized protein
VDLPLQLAWPIVASSALLFTLAFLRLDGSKDRTTRLSQNGRLRPEASILHLKRPLHLRIGLLNTQTLPDNCGVLLHGTRSVHTSGMLFPIDIIFISGENQITQIAPNVPPGRKMQGNKKSCKVLELAGGSNERFWNMQVGDQIHFT